MRKKEFSVEAKFRRRLINLRLEFMKKQMEILREMTPFVFGKNLPEEERESLRRLFTWLADDFSTNSGQGEELLLSDGPLIVVKNPNEEH